MRRFLLLPLVLLAGVLPFVESLVAQQPARKPRKVALLIGPKEYLHDFTTLKHLDDDVTALAVELRKGGFDEVVVLTDTPEGANPATRKNILAELDRLLSGGGDATKAIRKDDVVLLALSGHGQEAFVDGKTKDTFFAPTDGKKKDPDTLVKVTDVLDKVSGCGCRTLVLADMCRDIYDPNKGKGVDTDNLKLPRNAAILFGCESTQQSFVNTDLKHSLFTYAVLEVLRESNKAGQPLLWSELVAGVEKKFDSDQFKKLMGDDRHQSPVERKTDLKATALMARGGGAPPVAPPMPKAEETTETYTWKGEKRTRTVRNLKCGTTTMDFVKVPAGKFTMGSDKAKDTYAEDHETPAHTVTFTKPLWVAKYPVTKGQFAAFVAAKGYQTEAEADGKRVLGFDGKGFEVGEKYSWKETGWEQSDRHPVVHVSWNDGVAFCEWISAENKLKSGFAKKDGKWDLTDYKKPEGVRLLTEAEYEYANRGGTDTIYITGDNVDSLEGFANIADKSGRAKFSNWPIAPIDDGEAFTSPVGKYKANGFGLHDMTGNVWSWCADWYDAKQYARGDVRDPGANSAGEQKYRILRGGSWALSPNTNCRAAARFSNKPAIECSFYGFRVCVVLD